MKVQYLEAGEIVTTHGVGGEMKLLPWGDGPDFLTGFRRVRIDGAEYRIERCRVQKNCNLLKLQGIDTMEAAQSMRGKIVEVFREDAPKDAVFVAELMGMTVMADGRKLGEITDVLDYPANKVYVVRGDQEYMIPAVKEFVLSTDVESAVMQVRLIEGMGSNED